MTPPPSSPLRLRDVIDIRENVHAGRFKVDLTLGFSATQQMIDDYVVTDQLRTSFAQALSLVKSCVTDNRSEGAYLHGSFGSGKSHFLTVLHAILNNDPAARAKPGLQPIIADHDSWLRGRKFLMVPYHLVGAVDITSALLGGYVKTIGELHPGAPTPAVYRAESLLADAARQRALLADDAKFAASLGGDYVRTAAASEFDLAPLPGSAASSAWTTASLDTAFAARPGDDQRNHLIAALLDGPFSSYKAGMQGSAEAFIALEDGLAAMSQHTKSLGYDGLVLFLDELILWLQAYLNDKTFVNNEVSKLVKLIESGNANRPVPIISFISRQRDLSQLVGEDVVGADVKNLEQQVNYLAERFTVIPLEDRNLPAIIRERVLKKLPGAQAALNAAFDGVQSAAPEDRDILLDAHGATHADWSDFRDVYPLTPALLNVLVALSGALQRERTGLRIVHELLRRNADQELGRVIPVGDLWDVLTAGTGAAFTDRLKTEAADAQRLHGRVRTKLAERYAGDADNSRLVQDDLLVKTLLLSALAPDLPALSRLTGGKLAALNYGMLKSRVASAGSQAIGRLRELTAEFGEIRSDGEESNPVFSVHVSDLDVEPLLDTVGSADQPGARRIWVKDQLWKALGIAEDASTTSELTIVWRGTKRTAEFLFANVRDDTQLTTSQFEPITEGNIKFVLDYPFDDHDHAPSDDLARVEKLRRGGLRVPTYVWLPDFLSTSRSNQLGRLIKIRALLKANRLDEVAAHLSAEDRGRLRQQLKVNADSLGSQLTEVLRQAYGLTTGGDPSNLGAQVPDDAHLTSLLDGTHPQPRGVFGFDGAMLHLAESVFDKLYDKHPNFDPTKTRTLVTLRDFKAVQALIAQAMEDGSGRTVVERGQLGMAKRIVHALELGEVHDGPLVVSTEWRRRIDQQAAKAGLDPGDDLSVEKIRGWIEDLGYTGLDPHARNLIIAAYALIADKTWLFRQTPVVEPPALERIEPGYALRTQALPTEEEFTAAAERAGALFGVRVPPVRNARNTAQLARLVREKAQAPEAAVNGVRDSLRAHAGNLGLDGRAGQPGGDSGRLAATTAAAEILAKLVRPQDDTSLVRQLTAAQQSVTDQVLATTISSAQNLLNALDNTEWPIVDSVRAMSQRDDDLGEQAALLVQRLTAAAVGDEFTVSLAEVLREGRSRGVTLLAESNRRASVALSLQPETVQPTVSPTGATPSQSSAEPAAQTPSPSASEVRLTEHGVPPVSGGFGSAPLSGVPGTSPGPRSGSRRVRLAPAQAGQAIALEAITAELSAELHDLAAANPGAIIEFSWLVVTGEEGA